MDALKPRERLLGPALRTQPDRRLVALARDGSTPAQEEVVRRYRAALVRYASSIVGPAAAEDVVQESLTKGIAALGAAGEELRLRPWLYAIVRNTAFNHLRDAGPATEQLDENYDGVEQPPQALERREGVRSLLSGLRRLPDQQREAIVKRELEGRSHEEIAAELGVSSGAARQLIFRAREALRVGFGSLLPMPLLRWLAESGGDAAVGVAAGAGGGALAAKAAVAVFAAGAAVTAGVALDHGARQHPAVPPAAEAAVRPVAPPQGAGRADPIVATAGEDESSSGSGPGGGDSSGPGSGDERGGDDGGGHSGHGGSSPSDHSGGTSGNDDFVAEDFSDDSGGHGERSGQSGSGHTGRGGDDDSGSSHGGRGSSNGGDDGAEDHSGSGSSGSGSSGSGSSGSGSSGSGGGSDDTDKSGSSSGGSGSSGGGSGSSGSSGSGSSGGDSESGSGGDDSVEEVVTSPTPPPAPAPAPVEESSSGSGSGDGSSDDLRDLSSGSVSQGSDDPD